MIKIAVLGYGTVGSGVVELIERNGALLKERAGEEIVIKYILDLRDFPGDPYEDKIIHDYGTILEDSQISILCEVMGGVGAAYRFTKQALEAGKSVCTSNKELVAKHGAELLAIAERMHCNYMFEASVAGGIPIIRTINSVLLADRVESVTGILNGTTNYILTKMEKENADYGEVLRQAQELGYAERNPEADVEGLDAGRKIAILADMLTGKNVDPDKIATEGISKITTADFACAKAAGMTIKLLARCSVSEDGSACVRVAPYMLALEHPLGRVDDVFNGIQVTCGMLGDALFGGKGAGKLPTASAVAADVMDCAMHPGKTVMRAWSEEAAVMDDVTETKSRFFVRTKASARDAVLEAFAGSTPVTAEGAEDAGFFTPAMREREFQAICSQLGDAVLNRIHLL